MSEKLTPLTELDRLQQNLEQLMRRPVPCTWGQLADLAAQIEQGRSLSAVLEHMFQRDLRVYAIPTTEAITAMAGWLRECGFRRVLEVGAGRGLLAAWLQSAWPEGQVVAQDDGSWKIDPWHPVVTMPLAEALHTVAPDCVISSWMPYGVDWTPVFRATPSVRAYLLIGEGPGGAVGTEEAWTTVDGWQETPLRGVAYRIWSSTDWLWVDGKWVRHAVVTAWERQPAAGVMIDQKMVMTDAGPYLVRCDTYVDQIVYYRVTERLYLSHPQKGGYTEKSRLFEMFSEAQAYFDWLLTAPPRRVPTA